MTPHRRELVATCNKIGKMMGEIMPEGIGFALLLFDLDLGEGGWMTYISSAVREDMIKAIKELLVHIEKGGGHV